MSCSLPQEILDLIIDHLRDEPDMLKICCVVSKPWVQRTRKYLFFHVKFHPLGRRVSGWRKTFPDLMNSPAHNTRVLSICHPWVITGPDVGTLRTFCGVVHLNVNTDLWSDQAVSLVPFHGFSPVIRSLHLTFTFLRNSKVFDLIYSLPLLEDLTLVSRARRRGDEMWNTPSTSPRFTGSLELRLLEGIQSTTDRLLDLPNGLRFTKITVPWLSEEDVLSTIRLISMCSGTLESLDIANYLSDASQGVSLDLSKATKLQNVVFRSKKGAKIEWITTALHTVESKNIQQISLELSNYVFWQTIRQEWLDLDSLLVQFWTSHSLRPKVMYESTAGGSADQRNVARLLPELMRRGIVDLAEYPYVRQDFPSFTTTLI